MPFQLTRNMKAIAIAAAAALLSAGVFASEITEIPQEEIMKFMGESEDIQMQALPMSQFVVSQRGNKVVYSSENGRYKFQGPIVDTWAQIEIKNYEDAKFSAEHLPMHNIGLKPEILDPLVYGNNPDQKVIAFVSPDDRYSVRFLRELPKLEDDYQVEIIVIPTPDTPHHVAAALSCVSDEEAAIKALITGKGLNSLTPTADCDLQMLMNRIIAYRLLGFLELPSIIAPSTRISIGDRADGWTKFLQENLQ